MPLLLPKLLGSVATLTFFLAAFAAGCGGSSETTAPCEGEGCLFDAGSGGGGGATGAGSAGGASDGGGDGCDETLATCPCDEGGGCAAGQACVKGLCIDACTWSYECGAGRLCVDGACVDGCNAVHPCDAGYACESGACVLDPESPACDDAHPCDVGQICSGGLCTTACDTSAQCDEGQVCDGAAHACIPDPSPKPICDAAHPCPVPQLCGFDGYCHYPCGDVAECKLVDDRYVACDQSVCKTQQEMFPECTIESPCPEGQSCVSNECH
jgi:hypothetical protein